MVVFIAPRSDGKGDTTIDFSRSITENMPRKERYTLYFESLRKVMNWHDWRSLYSSGTNWCRFLLKDDVVDLAVPIYSYTARFPRGDTEVAAMLVIRDNHELFEYLFGLKSEIESDFGCTLDWSQRLNRTPETDRKRQTFASRHGSIKSPERELKEIGEWHIKTLIKLNEAFAPRIKSYIVETA